MSSLSSIFARFRRRSDERRDLVRGHVESLHPMRIRGWAFGVDGEPLALRVRLYGEELPLPSEWHSRRDVAETHGEETLRSGFTGYPGEELGLLLSRALREGRLPEVLANGSPLGWPKLAEGRSYWRSEGDLLPSMLESVGRLAFIARDEGLFGLASEIRLALGKDEGPDALPALIAAFQRHFDAGDEQLVSDVIDRLASAGAFRVLPVELAIIRSCAPLSPPGLGRVDASMLEAAFLNWSHEVGEARRVRLSREGFREALSGVLARLALCRAFDASTPQGRDGLHALRLPLARWVDRLARVDTIALDFLDLLDVTSAAGREQELLLRARLDSSLKRHARALGTLCDLLAAGSQDWFVHHQSALLAKTFTISRLGLARRYLPAVVQRLAHASRLNPEQCQSRREAWNAVMDFARASVKDSAARAKFGNLGPAVDARSADLRLACVQALTAAGAGDSGNARALWRDRSRRKVLLWGSRGLFQCYKYRVCQRLAQAGVLDIEVDYLDISELIPAELQQPAEAATSTEREVPRQAESSPKPDAARKSEPQKEPDIPEDEESPRPHDWRRRLMGAAVLYACRVPATPEHLHVFAYARALGIPVIYDIDDLLFDPSAFPPPLHTYAGTIDEDAHVRLALDNPFFMEGLRFADQVTVSTAPLAREVTRHLGASVPVTVLPNLLDDHLAVTARAAGPARRRADGEIVIFHGSATKAHKEDFYSVFLPAVLEVLDAHPNARLELVGFFEDLPDALLNAGRVRLEPPTPDFEMYLARLREADISISVLEECRTTDVKSEIKWLEAAAYGIPSVVSPTAAYREVLTDGVDVLFARDTAQWREQLGRLVADASLRTRIGEAARAHALERFGPGQGVKILDAILEPLLPTPQSLPRKRVLLANVYYHPQSIGGATRVVEAQVRALRERMSAEFEVFVLTTNNDPDPQRPHSVTQYWHDDVLVTALEIPKREWPQAEDPEVEAFCREFLATYRIDLVHAHCIQVLTSSVLMAARALGIPYIITLHDGWWLSRYIFLVDENGDLVDHRDPLSGGTPRVGERAQLLARAQRLRSVLRGAERLLAVSPKFAKVYHEAGFPEVEVHENFGTLPDMPPSRRLPLKPNTEIVIGFIGGLSRHKGYHLVRRAIEAGEFRNVRMLVLDHGLAQGEHYRMQWGETPVEFIARRHQSEVAALYARLDVLLAPSIWPESYGLVTREAIHAGVWVIASDRGAIGDCVEEGVTGNVVSVADHQPLMEAIRRLPEMLARRGGNTARGRAPAVVSVDEHMQALQRTYREVLSRA